MTSLQRICGIKPYEEFKDDIEKIISDKNLNNYYSNMIRLSMPVIVSYYGTEHKDLILDTLRNINFVSLKAGENLYSAVENFRPDNIVKIENEFSELEKQNINDSLGVFSSNPIFKIENGLVVNVGTKSMISMRNERSRSLEKLSTFIHEFCHAIKSYKKSSILYTTKNNEQFLEERCGISKIYYKVKTDDEKILLEFVKEKNRALEEGINTCDEESIVNLILLSSDEDFPPEYLKLKQYFNLRRRNTVYHSQSYSLESKIACTILFLENLQETIKIDQLYGTTNSEKTFNQFYDPNVYSWLKLNQDLDQLLKLENEQDFQLAKTSLNKKGSCDIPFTYELKNNIISKLHDICSTRENDDMEK